MKLRRLAPFALLGAIALLWGACGGTAAAPAAPPATATAAPTQAAATASGRPGPDLLQSQGNPQAKVTLTVFEDFQCPICLRFTNEVEPTLLKEYVATGKVRYQFRQLPFLGKESGLAALGARCAAKQERFWQFHDRLFKTETDAGQLSTERIDVGRFRDAALRTIAGDLGLDLGKFDACYAANDTVTEVAVDIRYADSLGLPGTPSFLLNDLPISTPRTIDDWRKLLDAALK
jgi:protein-disulfide isomerase